MAAPHPESPDPVGSPSPPLLPLTVATPGQNPRLRADAARNRTRLLEAASRLAAEVGVSNLTMDAVAAAAQVGKGTVFRRFGDRTGLLIALLDHQEQRFQAGFLTGPPPLGPGAPPVERLHAFGPAVIRHEQAHHELLLAAQADPCRRYTVPAWQLRLTHLTMLLRRARVDGDLDLLAHALLAYLDTALVHHLLLRRSMPQERIEAGWHDLVDRVAGRCR